MKRYTDPEVTIQVAAGDRFGLELAGNPTTGYTWQVHVDRQHLDLLGQEFERGGTGVGAGGKEVFLFHALSAGETEISCDYRRPWDRESRDSKRFRVVISA